VVNIPRLVVAAPASGHGKTTVATGLMAALTARGMAVSGHKAGPDYIDPGYHALATGRPARNLDPVLCGADRIAPLFAHGAAGAGIAVIEGVMGLFDGRGATAEGSTAHVAGLLSAPVVLVTESVDLDAVISLARQAGPLSTTPWDPATELADSSPASVIMTSVSSQRHQSRDHDRGAGGGARGAGGSAGRPVVAVAGGAAFTFCYTETVELLTAAGADVVTVDPLRDEALPAGTGALVLGGGFPEVHASDLSGNEPLRADVTRLARSGAPVAAECAGLLYLARELDGLPMCGVLDATARMTPRLTLGYRDAVAAGSSVLTPAGTAVRGHEFHRTTVAPGNPAAPAWTFGGKGEGFVRAGVHASYLHLHWAGYPDLARRVVAAAA